MYLKAMDVNPADYQSPVFLAQACASLGRRHDEMKARQASLELLQWHLELNPRDMRALYASANQFCNVGEQERGIALVERALGQDDEEPIVLYNVSCFYARQGNTDRALSLLEKAVQRGWGDRAWLETDSDLDSLRAEPRFAALLGKMD